MASYEISAQFAEDCHRAQLGLILVKLPRRSRQSKSSPGLSSHGGGYTGGAIPPSDYPGGYGGGGYPGSFENAPGPYGGGGVGADSWDLGASGGSMPEVPFADAPVDSISTDPGGRELSRYLTAGGFLFSIAAVVLIIVGPRNLLLASPGFGLALLAFVVAAWGDTVDRRWRTARGLPGRLLVALVVRLAAAGIAIIAAWRVADIVAL